jgi:LacI family transcriptional regulator
MTTLKELAKLLNVSVSTVSKALSNAPDIGEDTKKRVKELAEALNYQPNKMAVGLKGSKTNTIGVIIPDILNPYFAEVLYGIEQRALRSGYDILISISNESTEKEIKGIEVLKQGRVDGFIMSVSMETIRQSDFSHLHELNKTKKLVLFDRIIDSVVCDKVSINDEQAVKQATTHFIKKGYKKIAFVSNIGALPLGEKRKQGYKKALEEAGIKTDDSLILDVSLPGEAHQNMKDFLDKHIPDAVISADNSSGIMMQSIARSKLNNTHKLFPIISFGSQKTSLLAYPPLSYINQNAQRMGEKAAELLIDYIQNPNTHQPTNYIQSTDLVEL